MPQDPEVSAIKLIVEALEPLEENARRRVYRFLRDRYGDDPRVSSKAEAPEPDREEDTVQAPNILVTTISELEALFATARASAQWQRALITGCWLQDVRRQTDFDALTVNGALRQCGYGISNITREFTKLATAGLVAVQPQKDGSKERRRFRVTREGMHWYRERLGQSET